MASTRLAVLYHRTIMVTERGATLSSGPRQCASSRESAGPADMDGAEAGGGCTPSRALPDAEDAGPLHQPALEAITASQRRVLGAEAAFTAGWQTLDAIDLEATLRKRVLTLQSVPVPLRSMPRTAFRAGLQLVADENSADS
ncbi:unnamed protein product [Symbiodinium sp. CCMP2592]|nr:unnamed protein product [Symbiodinium sp. CCMP2592]